MLKPFALLSILLLGGCSAALDQGQLDEVLALEGDPAAGEAFYTDNCQRCHGPGGNGDGSGSVLAGAGLTDDEVGTKVLKGPFSMPSFADEDSQPLADVIAYVQTL